MDLPPLHTAAAGWDAPRKSWRSNDDASSYLEAGNLIDDRNQGETDGKWLRETDKQARGRALD